MTTMPPGEPRTSAWIRDPHGSITWDEASCQVDQLCGDLRRAGYSRVAVEVRNGRQLVLALLAGLASDLEVILAGPGAPRETIAELRPQGVVSMVQVDGRIEIRSASAPGARNTDLLSSPGIWIFSSGTTGRPKATHWPWASIAPGSLQEPTPAGEFWGIGYAPFTFAAASAVGQALSRAGRIEFLAPRDLMSTDSYGDGFDVVAATPSFWRMAAVFALRGGHQLRKVVTASTGGEPVENSLLETLKTVVAPDRIVQIFGTTELGTLLSVTDGEAGLPGTLLGKRLPNGAAFDVADGCLRISKAAGLPFQSTGDTARVDGGRVYVTGREGLVINVGGRKVSPQRVCETVQRHPEVLAVRVYAVRSALLGHVVGVEVVPRSSGDRAAFAAEVKSYARLHLAPHECPRSVRVVDELRIAPSGKVDAHE
ncbi:AMP-binding protein [Kitasatospora sp. NPDC056138]|uniref:AMP-binding protein n=1 Tax=Kitasatospora sp. NPDC056138 TaxID=3345724 RepID=UPI0035D8ED09